MMTKWFYKIIAIAGLLILFIPSLLRFTGTLADPVMKNLMFIGTLVWFTGAIPWLGQKHHNEG